MKELQQKRHFSPLMHDTNSTFLPLQGSGQKATRIGFVLLEHFSMMAFTAAVDALVTANLVRTSPLFIFSTYGLDSLTVKSDLGIDISTSGVLGQLKPKSVVEVEILIVCGGFRCSLVEHKPLTAMLKNAARNNITLGGIWNGSISLAYAGVLNNKICALHPDNHAFMVEQFNRVRVSENVLEIEDQRITCAGPVSAQEMMFKLIEQIQGKSTVRAIREILSCDRIAEMGECKLIPISDKPLLPDGLRELILLMKSNIEEPINLKELADYVEISKRHVERLFQAHLETSPGRYYLELRITQARRLLLQSNASITNIALACGFVTTTHFSRCFKDYFGVTPTLARKKLFNLSN